MRVYVQLGKFGDIFSMMPILHNEFLKDGDRQALMVSREYMSAVEGASYIRPIIYDGHWQDLKGAITEAKKHFSEVVVTQTYGKDFPIQRKRPSFQLDQWNRAGAEKEFASSRLVLDKRNLIREKKLCSAYKGRKIILFADAGESRPFAGKEELAKLLADHFPSHLIVRLSWIKAESMTDFVGLYDMADALVTLDTAHLHLSSASKIPTVALVPSIPSRWHGAAQHPRFELYCRYDHFALRSDEIVKAVVAAIAKSPKIEIKKVETMFPNGYNPSFITHDGKLITVYRYHADGDWKTSMALHDGITHKIQMPERLAGNSVEDAKLFHYGGKLFMSFVTAREDYGLWTAYMVYGELLNRDGEWKIEEFFQPEFGRNGKGGMEKNWLFFEYKDRLMCVYGNSNNQTILELSGSKVVATHKSECATWSYGDMRGGCIIPWNDQLLRFFHSHSKSEDRNGWLYCIGAALMDGRPPFKTISVSRIPVLAGSENFTQCKHWKHNVVFPGGVIQDTGGWKLIYGNNDCECLVARLTEKDLNL